MTRQDAQASNVVVARTLQVNSFDAYMLFNLGLTYSYVSPFFASHFDESPVLLNPPFWVSTPMEGVLLVQSVFKSRVISASGMETLADLI